MPQIDRVVWEDNNGIDPESGTEINNDALQAIYDSIQEVIDAIEGQAAIVTPAYDAGRFTGSGTLTWAVGSGDVNAFSYTMLSDCVMLFNVVLFATSVSGTGTALRVAIPDGYTVAATSMHVPGLVNDNFSLKAEAIVVAEEGDAYVSLYVDTTQATNWSASTNGTSVAFKIAIFVNPPA